MADWREYIINEFSSGVSQLTIVDDPDCLLAEEIISQRITEKGFEIIDYTNSIEFRYIYETRYRSKWDSGKALELIIHVHSEDDKVDSLPFDILNKAKKISFSLHDIFPHLSYLIISELDLHNLDILYLSHTQYAQERLGDNATKDFVLRHVFGIAPELTKNASDLLRILLRLHYKGEVIPESLNKRFIQLLRQKNSFKGWPIEDIIPSRQKFFEFLQDGWQTYLNKQINHGYADTRDIDIPFGHDDVKIYIDNFFLEGFLQPVEFDCIDRFSDSWVTVGIIDGTCEDETRILDGLLKDIEEEIPGPEAKYNDWLDFARKWAKVSSAFYNATTNVVLHYNELHTKCTARINESFEKWLHIRYACLYNLPSVNPVMVHHIPRVMARKLNTDHHEKVALIVLDGLSLAQWYTLSDILHSQDKCLSIEERAVFAWIPTLTSISRQAIFAGKPPMYFPSSINSTDMEAKSWRQFWIENNVRPHLIQYYRSIDDKDFDIFANEISNSNTQILGLVLGKIDKIMHGMELGSAGMHNQIKQWVNEGFLLRLLRVLIEENYCIYLTSDHGNIESVGFGRPSEGSVADMKGERVRIYQNSKIRQKINDEFPASIQWPQIGLPEDYMPLIATSNNAFTTKGNKTVAHGGISIEEVIVPFVCLERRGN